MNSSPQPSTPVHLHPLSSDNALPRGTLSEADAKDVVAISHPRPNRDERHGAGEERDALQRRASVASFSAFGQKSPGSATGPRFVVGPPYDNAHFLPASPEAPPELSSPFATQVLSNTWHSYSDEYHAALRVLSSAVHHMSRACLELEEYCRVLEEKSSAQKQRAEALLQENPRAGESVVPVANTPTSVPNTSALIRPSDDISTHVLQSTREKASIGEWIGGWLQRSRPKSQRSVSAITVKRTEGLVVNASQDEPVVSGSVTAGMNTSTFRSASAPPQKQSRSVFEALGISLPNTTPTIVYFQTAQTRRSRPPIPPSPLLQRELPKLHLLIQPPSLRSPEPRSQSLAEEKQLPMLLADQGREVGPLIRKLAFELVQIAREESLSFRERRERKGKGTEVAQQVVARATLAPVEGMDVTASLTRTLAAQGEIRKAKPRKAVLTTASFTSPIFGALMPQGQRKACCRSRMAVPRNIHDQPPSVSRHQPIQYPVQPPTNKPGSAKPPTQYLSRRHTPLTTPDFHFTAPLPNSASRFNPLTDRYGFIYDVCLYDLLLLIRAKECGNTAPGCLTGTEEEETPGSQVDIVKGDCECNGSGSPPFVKALERGNIDSASRSLPADGPWADYWRLYRVIPLFLLVAARARVQCLRIVQLRSPALMPTHSWASVLSVTPNTPPHACAKTIRRLLQELTRIHDQRQDTKRKEWDTFVKHRRKGLGTRDEAEELLHTEGLIGFAQLGLSSGRDEKKEFDRLIRGGIPLAYRSKLWLECSGGLEMREPGLFADLLARSDTHETAVTEIEKDVGRTMPLNIFFGGDGAGVDKLRRVLTAYSRRNPTVGYLHADEEEAFWHILPEEFFSPSLLPSRACPLVLLDYVQEFLPKLFAHLAALGVDLPAICFSWFLSLFTDCLPIETLFRVWDVFLLDGLDVLFRKLLQCESNSAVYVALENLPMRMWLPDKLLQLEFELRSSILHADLVKRRGARVAELRHLTS
ncbi:small G protein signaling modulator 3 [Pisolithus marmoratus]|nr:small G protein signaling modulator 3 [Pisolithus marmoratus]